MKARDLPAHTFLIGATAVLLLTAVFRMINLQDLPPGLVRDEILNADLVTFIWDGRLTLFFSEGYGHEPLYHYLVAPFQKLFGDNYLAIRMPSVFIGMILVAATMRWIRRAFDTTASFTTGILLAVSWWPIIFSRIGLRAILTPVLLVAMALTWRKRPFLSGLFLALSVYTYTAARAALLIPIFFLAWAWIAKRPSASTSHTSQFRQWLKPMLITLITAVSLCLPLYLTIRANPDLQERINQLSGPLDALWQGNFQPILTSLAATAGVFSVRGDPLASYMMPGEPLFGAITAVLFYLGLGLSLWRWRRAPYALALIWLGLLMLPSALSADAPSSIRLIGAMPVVYLMPGIGTSWLFTTLQQRGFSNKPTRAYWALLPALTLILILNATRTIQTGFNAWASLPETRQKYQSIWLDIARDWREGGGERPLIVADSWYEPIKGDSLRRDLGYDPQARWVQQGGAIVFPAGGNGRFYVPEFATIDPHLMQAAGLTEPDYRNTNAPSFARYAMPAIPTVPQLDAPIQLGNALSLLGFDSILNSDQNQFIILTWWHVDTPLPHDLSTFMHLLDANGNLISQFDGLDAMPGTLFPGDMFVQRHVVELGETAVAHKLLLGAYTRQNNQRLIQPQSGLDHIVLIDAFSPENQANK